MKSATTLRFTPALPSELGGLVVLLLLLLSAFCAPSALGQGIPVRISFKFILNASGTRSGCGNLNTDDEVDAQVARANQIFSQAISELRFEKLSIEDVAGISPWYAVGVSEQERDNLRTAAIKDQTAYHWRNDAVNVYITSANVSAVSDFAPNNNIIVMGQGAFDTTLAHELGHILNLCHTHQSANDGPCGGGDACGDTLMDNPAWTKEEIARNNYGKSYDQTDATQHFLVDVTYGNLMSYHDPDNRSLLTVCQLDRLSHEAYWDRYWLISRRPVYVNGGYGGTHRGSFTEPYQTIQQALAAGALPGSVVVLTQGTHARPAAPLNIPVDIVTRVGPASLPDAAPRFSLPYAVEQSARPAVRNAMLRALRADPHDVDAVIGNLRDAERAATGRERSAIQLEIAQRLRDAGRYPQAAASFEEVAREADQPELRQHAINKAGVMKRHAAKTGN